MAGRQPRLYKLSLQESFHAAVAENMSSLPQGSYPECEHRAPEEYARDVRGKLHYATQTNKHEDGTQGASTLHTVCFAPSISQKLVSLQPSTLSQDELDPLRGSFVGSGALLAAQ